MAAKSGLAFRRAANIADVRVVEIYIVFSLEDYIFSFLIRLRAVEHHLAAFLILDFVANTFHDPDLFEVLLFPLRYPVLKHLRIDYQMILVPPEWAPHLLERRVILGYI